MSSALPLIDLTGAIAGQTRILDFSQFMKFNPAQWSEKAVLVCFNESACGLQLAMQQSGNAQFLPAGAWTTFTLEPNDSNILITVLYVLPNPPVSTFISIYYAPGEKPPQSYTLGNSPIGIGGTIATMGSTLSNEGNAAGTLTIDLGPVSLANLIQFWNDHFLISVDQSGVSHQVLAGNTSGNPLQIGQAGDISEVLGKLTVDQVLTAISAIINTINSQAATNLALNVPTGQKISFQVNAVESAFIDSNGLNTGTPGKLSRAASGDIIDASGNDTFIKARSTGTIHFQAPNGTTVWDINNAGDFQWISGSSKLGLKTGAIREISNGTVTTGSLSTLVNHGLSAAPFAVMVTTDSSTSTATVGASGYTATQFSLINGANPTSLTFQWFAFR